MKRILKPFIWLTIFVLIVGFACASSSETAEPAPTSPPEPTAVPAPTEAPPTPVPTEVPPTEVPPTEVPPTEVPPTEAPPPDTGELGGGSGDSDTGGVAFELESSSYRHADGLFEIFPPVGWSVEEDSSSISIAAPDDSGFIYLQVTNIGYEFDGEAFESFIDAREANFFGGFSNYGELDRRMDVDSGVAEVMKTVTFSGVPQTIFTLYDQHGGAMYAMDFWADSDVYEEYVEQYDVIMDTASVDSSAAADLDTYIWIYTFDGPDELFTFQVPTPWRYETDSNDTVIVDTFYAPDGHGIVQNILYDDGDEVSKSLAGQFALTLLQNFYADDIKITDDQVQTDGSERLTWNSPSGEYSGVSFFETRGSTFLLFTVMWDNDYEDIYWPVLDYTISTYDVP